MGEADYYPLGAYNDPDAPYNQPCNFNKSFRVTISQTLSKNVVVETDDYCLIEDIDEDGVYCVPETESTNWKEAYESNHLKIQDLLAELKKYIIEDLHSNPQKEKKRLEYLLSECEGWVEDDYEVVE